ncbi:hypothetical protein GCK72_019348 [Caenorhabditis remanei]|uniref:Uncharacterized protein n=3 Tax=Caenorhabditis TaxID=6237 RepID=E3LK66_CAERE|nr:hypothetical protein GCK72_019348 [Caenorhabditis remanei]EFO99997.1 hypothetical protein CRE_18931 [Caenorhabditis remanei]KAF1752793.1 hypothetical protein GCK72_019348 [Caenorhabditis remanei]
MNPTMSAAPPDYCETVDETITANSKDEMPPVYVMDVNNLTWQRSFPPTYDDEERQFDEPLRSIEAEIDSEQTRMYRCGPCVLSETKSFLLCFFTVFLGLLILLPTLFFVTVLSKDQDPNVSPSI